MPVVKQLDYPSLAEQTAILRKVAIQRQNLINTDFSRAVTQFAEIKPLSALYKPIQDSMAGIFQNKTFFTYLKDIVYFNNEGTVAFIDDLKSKNIRSSVAIAQALDDVATNAPQVGQARANYARELSRAFFSINESEMTTPQIIAVLEAVSGEVRGVPITAVAGRPVEDRPRSPAGEAAEAATREPSRSKVDRAVSALLAIKSGKTRSIAEVQKDMANIIAKLTKEEADEVAKQLQSVSPSLPKYKQDVLESELVGIFKTGKGLIIGEDEAIQRFKLLLGSIRAGNTSKRVKSELKQLSDELFKKGHISKDMNLRVQNI